jgi:hypothetical protein
LIDTVSGTHLWADRFDGSQYRGIHILDRGVRLPTPTSEHTTGIPASREARIKSNSTVSQCRHCTDVLAEVEPVLMVESECGAVATCSAR